MFKTEQELLDHIRGGTVIHCTTAEQARAVLSFCRQMGLKLYEYAESWLDSREGLNMEYPNVRFDTSRNFVVRYTNEALRCGNFLEFEDIAPILLGETQPDYEIDDAVFDALFS